jgi:NAD-dependent SIR2 family protein deacetylase
MTTTIFLGAGASAAEGAPTQGGVFQRYLLKLLEPDEIAGLYTSPWYPQLAIPTFFRNMFGIDIYKTAPTSADFPTFEEALGVLELAISRGQGFGELSYRLGDRPTNYPTLHQMRSILIDALTSVLSDCLTSRIGVHEELCSQLRSRGLWDSVAFVTTNYDLFADNALKTARGSESIEYGCAFDEASALTLSDKPISLLKIHGSLDWLACQTCSTVVHAAEEDVRHLEHGLQCKTCRSFIHPLIVPPSFFKQMDNVVLSCVWRAFESLLRKTDHIVFCGYSLPDADIHVKYALKRREVISSNRLRITVVNEHQGKSDRDRQDEQFRFKRFLSAPVDYTVLSFEDFAACPEKIISV